MDRHKVKVPEGFTIIGSVVEPSPPDLEARGDPEYPKPEATPAGFDVIGAPEPDPVPYHDWDEPEQINDPSIKGWVTPSVSVEDGKLVFKKPTWWERVSVDVKKKLKKSLI